MNAWEILAEEGRIRRRYSSGRCHKPLIRRFPNGEIHPDFVGITKHKNKFARIYIVFGGVRREPKHPSNARNINHRDSLSSGERKGNSLNPPQRWVLQGRRYSMYFL